MAVATKHGAVTKALALDIIEGTIPIGSVLSLAQIQEDFAVSRTVAREAMRRLETAGLIESKRRVGLTVKPREQWETLSPSLISWRLASSERNEQLRSLSELRAAVEPLAVAGAAVNADQAQRGELLRLSRALRKHAESGDQSAFLAVDVEFHRLLLIASKNELFAGLSRVFEASLVGRVEQGLFPDHPQVGAVDLHEQVAQAVADGDPEDGFEAMVAMLDVIRQELFAD